MHTHNATLYPMLAVGAFMAMFWTGVVAGHALGLGCLALLLTALVSACLGTIGVCELERRDRHGMPVEATPPVSATAAKAGTARTSPAPPQARNRRPAGVGAGVRVRSEPC